MASKRIPYITLHKHKTFFPFYINRKHFFLFVNDVTKLYPRANDTRKMEEIISWSKQKL